MAMMRAVVLVALALAAFAIVRRADIPDTEYRVNDSAYPGVFAWPAKGVCAATLIDPWHALSAAHCLEGRGSVQIELPISKNPINVTIDGARNRVIGAYANPCFAGDMPGSADLVVLRLEREAKTYYPMYDERVAGSEVGQNFTLVGWGDHGPAGPDPPECPGAGPGCGLLREGENKYDEELCNVLTYRFDDPRREGSSAVPREAVASSGDAGGPSFITAGGRKYLAGVSSGGKCCEYGGVSQYVRVSTPLTQRWVQESINRGEAASASCVGAWAPTKTCAGGAATPSNKWWLNATTLSSRWWMIRAFGNTTHVHYHGANSSKNDSNSSRNDSNSSVREWEWNVMRVKFWTASGELRPNASGCNAYDSGLPLNHAHRDENDPPSNAFEDDNKWWGGELNVSGSLYLGINCKNATEVVEIQILQPYADNHSSWLDSLGHNESGHPVASISVMAFDAYHHTKDGWRVLSKMNAKGGEWQTIYKAKQESRGNSSRNASAPASVAAADVRADGGVGHVAWPRDEQGMLRREPARSPVGGAAAQLKIVRPVA